MQINSRKLGRTVTFNRRGVYVYADLGHHPQYRYVQICAGGQLNGATVMWSGDDDSAFAAFCRRWFRAYLRNYAL
jgi:hypothetical protein